MIEYQWFGYYGNGPGDFAAHDGNQWLELAASQSYGIQKSIKTEIGMQYELSFAFAPHPFEALATSILNVVIEKDPCVSFASNILGTQTGRGWHEFIFF